MNVATTCPKCGKTSHNKKDWLEGYCGSCQDWTGEPGLADVMVRDPFTTPIEFTPQPPFQELLRSAIPPEKRKGIAILATPTKRPKHVIDAKAGTCDVCGGGVWLSPSSLRVADGERTIVCLACVEKAAGWTAETMNGFIRGQTG